MLFSSVRAALKVNKAEQNFEFDLIIKNRHGESWYKICFLEEDELKKQTIRDLEG